jgi:DNA-binding beta-propeller fold protein YncE
MVRARPALRFVVFVAASQFLLLVLAGTCHAVEPRNRQTQGRCNQPGREPVAFLELPGTPFQAVAALDGCWIFVSLPGGQTTSAIALVRRSAGRVSLARVVPVPGTPMGLALTYDGKVLIAAAGDRVLFLDVGKLVKGDADAMLGSLMEQRPSGDIYVNVTSDDRTAFVSNESASTITVIDVAAARGSGYTPAAVIGRIPVGRAPIALTFSPDERLLYTTSQIAPATDESPMECRPEGANFDATPPNHKKGAVIVVDVARANTSPATSVVAVVPAGCNPVRLALSPDGKVAYVTARGDHSVLAFDTQKLIADVHHALLATVKVGTAPVGIAVVDHGRKVIATNSNRFGGDTADRQTLAVVDVRGITSGIAKVVGRIPAGAFPRELTLTPDGRTLLLTNFSSKTLELIDVARATWKRTTR